MCIVSSRFEILVEGVDNAALAGEVKSAIRDSFRQMSLPGAWRVVVRPAHGGQWDFSIYGLDARHLLPIAVPLNLLPELIPRGLRESLNPITKPTDR